MRLRRSEPLDPHAFAALGRPSTEPAPEERGVAAAESLRVRSALTALPEEQRRALLLAAFYGRTAREISELERVPLGTAKTRIRTAMSKLRAALEVTDER